MTLLKRRSRPTTRDGVLGHIGRRQFLMGTAGATLALPFLPSLLSGDAQAAGPDTRKRFVAMATRHGGVWPEYMYPDDSLLMAGQDYAGHEVRWGDIGFSQRGDIGHISSVLSGKGLSAPLAQKMNILRGIDVPFYLAHHLGGHLGNYASNFGNGLNSLEVQSHPRPTIDQIMAWSPEFYPTLDGVLERSMHIGGGGMSHNWANPAAQSGEIQLVGVQNSSRAMFDKIFVSPDASASTRTPIADKVLQSYTRLRSSNRRLSAQDKRRLDEHIERVDELQRKLSTDVACAGISVPSKDSWTTYNQQGYHFDPAMMREFWSLHNDVIAAAFACGTSSIATMHCNDTFSMFQGEWHPDVAHQASLTDAVSQTILREAHQDFFESVFLDLANKLDAIDDGDGRSVLDNTLMMWTQECGSLTHLSYSIPIVTAGSVAGQWSTGRYLDYRNLSVTKENWNNPKLNQNPGLIYNQWLGNVLDAMGLSAPTYERGGVGGYGHLRIGDEGWYQQPGYYPQSVQDVMGQRLPHLWA